MHKRDIFHETFDDASNFNTSMVDGNGASLNFFSDGSGDYFGLYKGDGASAFSGTSGVGTDSRPSSLSTVTGMTGAYLALEDIDGTNSNPTGFSGPFTLTWPYHGACVAGDLWVSGKFAATVRAPHGKLPTS